MPTFTPDTLCLIYAGGTFGCHGMPLATLPNEQFLPAFLSSLDKPNLHILPNTIIKDSSTLTPADFLHFYELIKTAHSQGAARFLLITGTDTLSYLAAFLSIGLADLPIKLAITGSMLPFFEPSTTSLNKDPKSDAWHNLKTALDFLENEKETGVAVSFAGQLFQADSLQKMHTSDQNAFVGTVFGEAKTPPSPHALASFHLNGEPTPTIHTLYCMPNHADTLAISLEAFAQAPASAVIIIGYGAGNLPESPRLSHAISTLTAKNTLVIMASACPFGDISQDYAAGAWQYALGMVSGGSLRLPAIYAYTLWLCLGLPSHARKTVWLELFGGAA